VTADDPSVAAQGLSLTCEVDGDTVQKADTGDLVFDPATLVAYVSEIVTLAPSDAGPLSGVRFGPRHPDRGNRGVP
jgi:acylpyruvate hydrolase